MRKDEGSRKIINQTTKKERKQKNQQFNEEWESTTLEAWKARKREAKRSKMLADLFTAL